jgi:arsenate reductase
MHRSRAAVAAFRQFALSSCKANDMITLYGIKNCDTVKKARSWLDANAIAYRFHDFRADGIDTATISAWLKALGADMLVNKRGTTWRGLDSSLQAQVGTPRTADILCQHPALIKRPVLVRDGKVYCGFSDAQYRQIFC